MNIAALVKKARRDAGLTQLELADRIGTTQSAISRLESGRVQPSVDMLQRVADACGATLDLRISPVPVDPGDLVSTLALTPTERLDQLVCTVRYILAGRRALADPSA